MTTATPTMVIVLYGGPADGKILEVSETTHVLNVATRSGVTPSKPPADGDLLPPYLTTTYRRTSSIDDDGTRHFTCHATP